MADNDIETRQGDHDGTADQSQVENSEVARGKAPGVDGSPQTDGEPAAAGEADADWGFAGDKDGMATETKIGLALILVLLCAFAFVVYRKLDRQPNLAAAASDSETVVSLESETGRGDNSAEASNAARVSTASADVSEGERAAWDGSTLDVENSEPGDQFAPARLQPVSAQPTREQVASQQLPPDQFQPAGTTAQATTAVGSASALPGEEFFDEPQPDDSRSAQVPTETNPFGSTTDAVREPARLESAESRPAAIAAHDQETTNDLFGGPQDVAGDPFGSASPSDDPEVSQAAVDAANAFAGAAAAAATNSPQPAGQTSASSAPSDNFGAVAEFVPEATQAAYRPEESEDPFASAGTSEPAEQSAASASSADGNAELAGAQGTEDLFGDPSATAASAETGVQAVPDGDPFGGYQPIDTSQSAEVTTVVEGGDAAGGQGVMPLADGAADNDPFFDSRSDSATVAQTPPDAPLGNSAADTGAASAEEFPSGTQHFSSGTQPAAHPLAGHPNDARIATRQSGRSAGIATGANPFLDNRHQSGKPAVEIYEVRPGDNYWNISRKMYGTARFFKALDRANRPRIPDPSRLRPGMKVLVPAAEDLQAYYPDLFPRPASDSSSAEAPSGLVFDDQGRPFYRIGSRDTLSEIAYRHLGRASRWIQIYEMNQSILKSPNDLKIGTVLRLPADASAVEVDQ